MAHVRRGANARTLRIARAIKAHRYTPKGTPDGHGPLVCGTHDCEYRLWMQAAPEVVK